MEGELSDLSIYPTTENECAQCVQYLCNLAFADMGAPFDPCKNTKFPGTLVVSVSRAMLPRIRGRPSVHKAYSQTDILPWINPVERHIPPLMMGNTRERYEEKLAIIMEFGGQTLDFGDVNGLFEVVSPVWIRATNIDFGGPDGLFHIEGRPFSNPIRDNPK